MKKAPPPPCLGLVRALGGQGRFKLSCGALTFTLESNPNYGTITQFDPVSGAVSYSPNANFEGVDQFNFTVSAWGQNSGKQTVTLYVTPGPTLAADCRPYSIVLTWDLTTIEQLFGAGFAGAGFRVYRAPTPGGPYTLLTPSPLNSDARSYADASVVQNTPYYYVVTFLHTAYNCDGSQPIYESPYSNEVGPITTCCPPANGPFWTDYGGTAQELAQWVVGPGFTVQNASYTGAAPAKGIFGNANAAGFPINSGVILSSGDIALAKGPNDSSFAAKANSKLGDESLDNLVPGLTTKDAAVLQFDITSAVATNLTFEYIFASEEYPEWIHQINDIMAIFVNGVNIALVPITSLPVAVNNINGGWADGGLPATNPAYYVDNHDPDYSALPPYAAPSPVYILQYDGTTVILAAQTNISANTSYHIKIAIADATDEVYDSAVFIKAKGPCP